MDLLRKTEQPQTHDARLWPGVSRWIDQPDALPVSPVLSRPLSMAEEPQNIKPTLVEIRCQLMAAVAFAQIYAESHPEHADHLHHFVRDIQSISTKLGESVYGEPITD